MISPRNSFPRTYYFATDNEPDKNQLIFATNFNTTLKCDHEYGVMEYVNGLLPMIVQECQNRIPPTLDEKVNEQVEILRANRSCFLPIPPDGFIRDIIIMLTGS